MTEAISAARARELTDPEPQTAGYLTWPMEFWSADFEQRPFFSLYYADLMAFDHQVYFGTCVGNGPLHDLELEVTGPHPEVNQFIAKQWEKFWTTSAPKVLAAKKYGYLGGEVIYRETNGGIEFDTFLERHARDTLPLVVESQMVGITVQGVRRAEYSQKTKLRGLKAIWFHYRAEHGSRFGSAIYSRAFDPWYEKRMQGGAVSLRKLRMVKDAWTGDIIKVPIQKAVRRPDGTEISWREIGREFTSCKASGATAVLPSDVDGEGHALFDYIKATDVSGATPILEYIDALDWDILDGLLVPKEVIEASETGSGYSGRKIPFETFLANADQDAREVVWQWYRQMGFKLAVIKYGYSKVIATRVQPKSLLKEFRNQATEAEKREQESRGGAAMMAPGMLSKMMQRGENGKAQQFSTDGGYKYSSTQLNLPPQISETVKKLAAAIPDAELAEDGREDEPHVTLKYGLHTDDPQRVIDALRGQGIARLTFGETSYFECDGYDVVKIDVTSDDLHRLNCRVSDLIPHTDTHPEYVPHVTLAYVLPGLGQKYAGENELTGVTVGLDRVVFSATDGERTFIPLVDATQFATVEEELPAATRQVNRVAKHATNGATVLASDISTRLNKLLKKKRPT